MLSLTLTHTDFGEREIELSEEALHDEGAWIGRSNRSAVLLEDSTVSRKHARLFLREQAVQVEDVGSTSGTAVNGRRLAPKHSLRLMVGDVLVIGGHRITVTAIGSREETLSPSLLLAPLVSGYMPVAEPPTEGWRAWTGGDQMVRVARIIDETPDIRTFVLIADPPVLFRYQPGQFVVLHLTIDGQSVRRSYTLSSSPSRPHQLAITVKRVHAAASHLSPGVVSNWLHDHLHCGDRLMLSGPHGDFSCHRHPNPRLLLISAGVGITPMLSMVRWLSDTGAMVDTVLVHSVRTSRDLVARREIEMLASQDPRLHLVVCATRPDTESGWFGINGRIDLELLKRSAPDLKRREVFCCGPEGFMAAIKDMLLNAGLPESRYHQESFGARRYPSPAPSPEAPTPPSGKPAVVR